MVAFLATRTLSAIARPLVLQILLEKPLAGSTKDYRGKRTNRIAGYRNGSVTSEGLQTITTTINNEPSLRSITGMSKGQIQ